MRFFFFFFLLGFFFFFFFFFVPFFFFFLCCHNKNLLAPRPPMTIDFIRPLTNTVPLSPIAEHFDATGAPEHGFSLPSPALHNMSSKRRVSSSSVSPMRRSSWKR